MSGTLDVQVGPVTVTLLSDDRICKSILSGKPFEPDSLLAWAEMCKPATEVIDVGAYSGLFAIAAAKLGCENVVAMEPMPPMFRRLVDNAKANNVSLVLMEMAAASAEGKAPLYYDTQVDLTSGASLRERGNTHIEVDTVRLDRLPVTNVSAIKIDVERYELPVLAGARALLDRCYPSLLIEVLTEKQRQYVEKTLPEYRVAGFLDNRNLWLEPR